VITGGWLDGGVLDADTMAGVSAEVAEAEPATLPAVTRERMLLPTSAAVSAYVLADAPAITLQAVPPELHCCHSYV
jgi:hypothetical protein